MTSRLKPVERVAIALGAIFVIDRLLKLACVVHFFSKRRRPAPGGYPTRPLEPWPTVTLVQPITKGSSESRVDLGKALDARARLDYPARIQHLLV